jgi:hypothetical protein
MLKRLTICIALFSHSASLLANNQGPNSPIGDEAVAGQKALQKQWGAHAPNGWRIIMAATGSISDAKSDDVILVVEDQNPANIVTNNSLGMPELNTNPRTLLLLTKQGESYAVTGRYEGFLPSEGDPESPCLADPLAEGPGISVKGRVLTIGLQYWYSCGSWYVNRNTYKFRVEKNRLRLIGLDSWSFHRASGMADTTSINYLTGRKKQVDNVRELGPVPEPEEDVEPLPSTTKWSKVKRGPYYLDSMKREQCAEYENAPEWC